MGIVAAVARLADNRGTHAIRSLLMRYRDQNGQGWADVIDFLTMYPDARRRAVWLLGGIAAQKPDAGMTDSLRFASPNDGKSKEHAESEPRRMED
jgi:hypothetical protein